MSTAHATVVNRNYEPTANDKAVLSVLRDGRADGRPWGRANPRFLIDETGLSKSNVEFSLRSLDNAGWVDRPARGLYELVYDGEELVTRTED